MPVSKHRKKHAQKLLQRKAEIVQYRNRMEKAYKEMYEQLRNKSTSVADMLNKEEAEQKIDVRSVLPLEEIIGEDGKPLTVITLPEPDPNEPISIVSQWEEQSPEQRAINESGVITTTHSTND